MTDRLIQPPFFLFGAVSLPIPILSSRFGVSEVRLSAELSLSLAGTQWAPSSLSCCLPLVWEFSLCWFFSLFLHLVFLLRIPLARSWNSGCTPVPALRVYQICVCAGRTLTEPCWSAHPRVLSPCCLLTIMYLGLPTPLCSSFSWKPGQHAMALPSTTLCDVCCLSRCCWWSEISFTA